MKSLGTPQMTTNFEPSENSDVLDTENKFLFTSEHVGSGHPDKLADTISDSLLDACFAAGIERCAIETAIFQNKVIIFGECGGGPMNYPQYAQKTEFLEEIVDVKATVQKVLADAGYNDSDGTNWEKVDVKCHVIRQSGNISDAVLNNQTSSHESNESLREEHLSAGDQGIMFGYATNESEEMMPVSLLIARSTCSLLDKLRKEHKFIRSDCKAQATVEYFERKGELVPSKITALVISIHHVANLCDFREEMIKSIQKTLQDIDNGAKIGIKKHFKSQDELLTLDVMDLLRLFLKCQICLKNSYGLITEETQFFIQPSGKFEIGGPFADSGLTGRKIICDTYGGFGSHGGGAFSGKDWTKMDRTGAYAARWIAVSLIHSGICKRACVQLGYIIGVEDVISINVETYGTSEKTNEEIVGIIQRNFDLRPSQ